VNLFRNLADILFLMIILFPIVLNILRQARIETQIARVSHMLLFGIICVFFVAHVTIWDLDNIHTLTGQKLVDTKSGNSATFVTLYLVAALSVCAWIGAAVHKSRRSGDGVRSAYFLFSFPTTTVIIEKG
jgi:ABC-type glycerol-3-phosphate transport system permease component